MRQKIPKKLYDAVTNFLGLDFEIIQTNLEFGVIYNDSNEEPSRFHLAIDKYGELYIVADKEIKAYAVSLHDPRCQNSMKSQAKTTP